MSSKDTTTKISKYRLTWNNESGEQKASFWLKQTEKPNSDVAALLNLVELDADDFNYEYKLEIVEERELV